MLITAKDIITASFSLYKNNWRKFFPYLIMIFLPTLIISFLGAASLYLYVYLPSSNFTSSLILLAVIIAGMIFTIWVAAAFTKTLYACANCQEPVAWKETMANSSHLIWPIIFTSALVALIVLGGTILFIIPGIIFTIWYIFISYVIILEGKTGLSALRASKELVVGRWWSIVWRLFVSGLIFGISAAIVISLLDKGLQLIFPNSGLYYLLLSALSSALINTVITPLTTAAGLILYSSAKQNPVLQTTAITPEQPK